MKWPALLLAFAVAAEPPIVPRQVCIDEPLLNKRLVQLRARLSEVRREFEIWKWQDNGLTRSITVLLPPTEDRVLCYLREAEEVLWGPGDQNGSSNREHHVTDVRQR
jgi:hypothetical protein